MDELEETTSANALPERVGPYQIVGRLGRGGMGEVLEGYDDRLDRPVALKRILPEARDPSKARQRFRREARAAARLSDSAIVQIYDWVEHDEHDWLVMEKVDGRPLDQVLENGPIPVELALRIAREVASGLATAHEAGLVHRDLKASNVMLVSGEGTSPDRAKILDFGIAKPLRGVGELPATTLTAEGQLVGTFAAMSPEQALAQTVDHRSDLFSLGTLLYEMLSGRQPFACPNPVETLSRICSWKQPALHTLDPAIPLGVSRLVDRLLAKEPARRPADTRQVVDHLDRLMSAMPPEPRAVDSTLDQATRAETHPGSGNGLLGSAARPSDGAPPESLPPNTTRRPRSSWVVAGLAALGLSLWGLTAWWGDPETPAPPASTSSPAGGSGAEALDPHQLFRRGMARLERHDRKGNIEQAIAEFQRALTLDQEYAPALAGLARAYWLDSVNDNQDPARREQALAAARRAVEANGFLALARTSLGMSLRETGKLDEAEDELERALELEPGNALALFELGKVHAARQDPARAEALYLKAVEADPDAWLYPCNLGVFYYGEGRWEEAETAFLRSLELAPDNYLVHRNLGAAYSMQGELEQAASHFQRALAIRPDNSVYANLGNIYFAQGLYPQSVSAFEKAIETGGASFYYSWGNLGDAYRWTPDQDLRAKEAYRRALQLLERELEISPGNTTLRTRALLYRSKMGDCTWRDDALRAVDALAEGDASAWLRIATAHEVCERRDSALSALGEALRSGYPVSAIASDPELRRLRLDPRYHRLVMELE